MGKSAAGSPAVLRFTVTPRQKQFILAKADEVLFGGAAGGGKSYGQLIDAMIYALRYPKSRQLILQRTYPELEKSLIRTSLEVYPQALYRYNAASHVGRFVNGSLIDFGYCDAERDRYRYQSAEYDVIRFDELTHFERTTYEYLISRLRGANLYPKSVRSATNPGGIGHSWVKSRFIDPAPPETPIQTQAGVRLFIPSRVEDNPFLLKMDPGYVRRLQNLSPSDYKMLARGDWNAAVGQYFDEFDEEVHVVRPYDIPAVRRYRAIDYGLDRFVCLWIALEKTGKAVVYREVAQSGCIISSAAQAIEKATPPGEEICATFAPPDLWNRRQETGQSAAEWFAKSGVVLTNASNARVAGWYAVKEALKVKNGQCGLCIFDCCRELIHCLPALQRDAGNPNDCAAEPHHLTHAPDALRYFFAGRPHTGQTETRSPVADFLAYGG